MKKFLLITILLFISCNTSPNVSKEEVMDLLSVLIKNQNVYLELMYPKVQNVLHLQAMHMMKIIIKLQILGMTMNMK